MTKNITDRLILIGGPPRSGTTFIAESLNTHPKIMTVIDDHRYECWTLYYYKTRVGLVQKIRSGKASKNQIPAALEKRILKKDLITGVAPSEKINSFPNSLPPKRPDEPPNYTDKLLLRRDVPIDFFKKDMFLCMKSPEISFVLPQLAQALPQTKFILVYRPIIEIAESMYRKAQLVKLPIYHKRWSKEKDQNGELIPPPGIHTCWRDAWKTAPDFHRCMIYAASYMRALETGLSHIPNERLLFYDHSMLRKHPRWVFAAIANFLGVEPHGFESAIRGLKEGEPQISYNLKIEYEKMEEELDLKSLYASIEALDSLK